MNTDNINSRIKNLKQLLLSDKISLPDAVDDFTELINSFHDNRINALDDETTLYLETLCSYTKNLLLKNKEVKQKIIQLNKVMILQELGVKFSDSELKELVSKK